jgi:hypothetical protein
MPGVVRISHALYRGLLVLYPYELRSRFGPEMSDVFRQQSRDAWARGGLRALLHVWSLALVELLTLALPARVCSAGVIVPVLSATSSLVLFLLFLWGISPHCHK